MADRLTPGNSANPLGRFGRGMNRMISALTTIPPTARSRLGRPVRAISDTRSWRPASEGESLPRHVRASAKLKWFGRQARVEAPCVWRFVKIGAPRGRRPISESSNDKTRDRFPGAGSIFTSCDVRNMPVICPTGQVFCYSRIIRSLDLFETLNRRQLSRGGRLGRSGRRRRTRLGCGLRLRRHARLRCSLHPRTRRGPSHAP